MKFSNKVTIDRIICGTVESLQVNVKFELKIFG